MMRKEYIQPNVLLLDESVVVLYVSSQEYTIPSGNVDDTGVGFGYGTADPEDALARSGYSVWDE